MLRGAGGCRVGGWESEWNINITMMVGMLIYIVTVMASIIINKTYYCCVKWHLSLVLGQVHFVAHQELDRAFVQSFSYF